ncbi:c-type cytochrome [Pollutibacter soli]|uniref:c-type cytochrome n=1 Tax=Pollutibacter soli TaxID=3034157 RepID=UPI0030139281
MMDNESNADLIRYGRALIAKTAFYFGPKGSVLKMSNGMNCQNCHLEAGTKPWGNNYSAVFSTYPKFRARSGSVENIYKRVNDCFQRSLNGSALDTNSREMQAMAAYINWVGKSVPREIKPVESGITDIPLLSRAADPTQGSVIYQQKCALCHGQNGQGQADSANIAYVYPPLWGTNSYTTAAGLYRISRLAGFVKDNMPFGVRHDSSVVTNEQAWDIAAFVNSQPRPEKVFEQDWPDITGKPFDHPYPPFADGFSAQQHKYGPFGPIKEWISRNQSSAKK